MTLAALWMFFSSLSGCVSKTEGGGEREEWDVAEQFFDRLVAAALGGAERLPDGLNHSSHLTSIQAARHTLKNHHQLTSDSPAPSLNNGSWIDSAARERLFWFT